MEIDTNDPPWIHIRYTQTVRRWHPDFWMRQWRLGRWFWDEISMFVVWSLRFHSKNPIVYIRLRGKNWDKA